MTKQMFSEKIKKKSETSILDQYRQKLSQPSLALATQLLYYTRARNNFACSKYIAYFYHIQNLKKC